jgi:hypothetical protein
MNESAASTALPQFLVEGHGPAEAGLHDGLSPADKTIMPPIEWRELLAIALLVALGDVTIYRGHGFAGFAMLLVLAMPLLLLGTPRPMLGQTGWLIAGMTLVLAGRSLWMGSPLTVLVGVGLLVAWSLTLHGRRPYVFDVIGHGVQTIASGLLGICDYVANLMQSRFKGSWAPLLTFGLPAAALVLFSTLFILANPDVVKAVVDVLADWLRVVESWLQQLNMGEGVFWVAAAWFATGLVRPMFLRLPPQFVMAQLLAAGERPVEREQRQAAELTIYGALRNTLVAVIALFAVYLVFEFATLWFRQFPKGFYYAGYAHQGAFWLTVALVSATVVLSLIFRGAVLHDPRAPQLRRLAWIWSVENVVLALTVYNRMHIYVDFNGMTRMRTIGLFGISTVVAGFCLVLWKILHNRSFGWLVSRQLWVLAIAVYLYALTPVDMLVHQYNVRRIMAGDLAPSVQISVHPISEEGLLVLQPLTQHPDLTIRSGIRALLAEREAAAETRAAQAPARGWTAYQLADVLLLKQLRSHRADWAEYRDDTTRGEAAFKAFQDYAYQWY